ncbi:unnamed protein product [Camellia sinensis]
MCSRWVVAHGFSARCVGRIVCGRVCTKTDGQPLIWAETLLQLHRSKPISLTHKFSPPPCWVPIVDNTLLKVKSEIQSQYMDRMEETRGSYLTKENSEGDISVKGLPGIQLTEEEKEIGNVGWKQFLDYILVSKGSLMLSSVIITQIGFVALQAVSSYWLAFSIQIPKIGSSILIGVYTTISTISTIFVYLRSLSAALLGLKASKAFFSNFTNSIFNAPMLFFDSTPVGRILTRASSDLCVVDFDIPFSFAFVVAPLIESVAIIGIMASVTWQVLFVAFFATAASKYVQGYYQASARELMRINGTTKAPVMNYAAETSLGVVTIRAFNMANRFFQNYLKLVDNDAKLFFYSNATMEWLILRVEALQNLTLFTAVFLLVLLPKGYVDPGLAGLSLSYALALTSTQVFMIQWYSSLANYIISVERIKQFMHIPSEPPAIVEDRRPPSSWPSKGRIDIQDLRALEKCQLKTTINMSDEGENWSVGQRQLFCLGRVLLRRNKFLVLDEATTSIDSTTDAILQRIIREEFSNCTVITVAYSVPTVIDSDMVMVLSFVSSKKRVSAVAISNDGLFVCFADKFGVVWVVDLDGLHENQASPNKKKAVTILAHYYSIITSLEYSPDGRFIVRVDWDFKIRVTVFPKKPLDGAHEIQSFCLGHTE